MSLLQDVLRPTSTIDQITAKLNKLNSTAGSETASNPDTELLDLSSDDEYEVIGVMSLPGTPRRVGSRVPTRPSSPSPGSGAINAHSSSRRIAGPLHLTPSKPARSSSLAPKSKTDPLRVFTTELNQKLFALLDVKDLARCSRVCLKWNKSQSLNYIWFQHYRKVEFNDSTLPTGKWTRKESKENWRKTFMRAARDRDHHELNGTSRYGYDTPVNSYSPFPAASYPRSGGSPSAPASGYVTPQQQREERWAEEIATINSAGPGGGFGNATTEAKVEARKMYKDREGRKAKSKSKSMMGAGSKDRTTVFGADESDE